MTEVAQQTDFLDDIFNLNDNDVKLNLGSLKKKNSISLDLESGFPQKNFTKEHQLEKNDTYLDYFELMEIPLSEAVWKLGKQILLHLKPQDRIALLYLTITLPLCFIAQDVSSMVWSGIFFRLFLIPTVVYFRCFCPYTTTSLGKNSYWYRLRLQHPLIKLVNRFCATSSRHPDGPDVIEIPIGWCEIVYRALDWYVVLLFVTLYSETGLIINNLHGTGRYDEALQRFEAQLFKGNPSTQLRDWYPFLNSKVLGEYLHLCYFAYYLIIFSAAFFPYFTRPRENFDSVVSALALGFFTCFGFYLVFPVEGPYWKFDRPEPEELSYFWIYIVRFVLLGSAKGTAMPSGHCAISTVCWLSAIRYHVPLAIVYLFFVPGLIFATVWCGFHYGLDAGSGTLWGILCAVTGFAISEAVPYVKPSFDSENYSRKTYKVVRN
eukprot:TRINITY_DN2719_c0_g1_i1.p1 TRINITY_DN2719_c0_g1~~TRINITY_DN2719_c0_g1_i1.p1  ORF type:complete len:434 (+),score=43.05 TRINITY_DN2719_c0_g1_i1:633-1934(+)